MESLEHLADCSLHDKVVSTPMLEDNKNDAEIGCHGDDRFDFGKKIFVGNVGYRVNWKQLRDFFSKFGTVMYTHIVKDHLKNQSRGIAFVTFSSDEEAAAVLQLPDCQLILEDRTMRVHQAEESKRITFKKYDQAQLITMVTDTCNVLSGTGPSLDDICDDLLLEIFSYLHVQSRLSTARVCQRWRRLSLRSWSAVKSLHFRNTFSRFRGLTDKLLQVLLCRCASSLVSLDLSASPWMLSDYSLDIVGHFCPSLTYLDLSGVAATNKSLKNLTKSCQKLKVIKLQRCQHVAEKGLWWVLHHCKDLETVDVAANPSVTGKCFHMAGPKIKIVNLSGCRALSDTGIEKLAELCPLIEDLDLQGCISLSDLAIDNLGNNFPNLHILGTSGWDSQLSDENWSPLGHSRNLVELDISMNLSVGDVTLAAVCSGCQKLKILDISGCHRKITELGLTSLAQLPVLEDLTASYLHVFQDDVLKLLAVNGCLRKLTARACSGLTDAGIQAVATHCNQLTHLDLSGNTRITNTSVAAIVESGQEFPRRTSLHLGGTSVSLTSLTSLTLPPSIEVSLMDLSVQHLIADREFLLPEPYDLDDEYDDGDVGPQAADTPKPALQLVGECPWLEDDTDDVQFQLNV